MPDFGDHRDLEKVAAHTVLKIFHLVCPVWLAFRVFTFERVEQFSPPQRSVRESAMMNDTDFTETNLSTPHKNHRFITAAGYVFVIAMGAIAMWVAPSPASVGPQQSLATANASVTPFGGTTGRVVLGQPEESQLPDGIARNLEVRSLDHSKLNNPDLIPAPNPAPMAVAAYN